MAEQLGRRLTLRLLLAAMVPGGGAALGAAAYVVLTTEFPPGGVLRFFGVTLVLAPLAIYAIGLHLGARLRAVRGLAPPPSKDALKAAILEVDGLSDFVFRSSFLQWPATVGAVALGFWAVTDGSTGAALRIFLIGLLFAPLVAFLGRFAYARAARAAIAALAGLGLTPREVVELLPPTRYRLRRWLVAFTALCAVIPSLLIVELSYVSSARALEEALGNPSAEARRALLVAAQDDVLWPLLVVCLLSSVVAVLAAALLGDNLKQPLRLIAEDAARVSSGELTAPRLVPADDEVWVVAAAFTLLKAQLQEAIFKLQRAGGSLSASSTQLVSTFEEQQQGATEQATALNETSATTEELARSAGQIAENAGAVAETAERTLEAAQEGQSSSEAFFASMVRLKQDNSAIADAVVKLNKRVQQIGRIIEFINGIADKSDLLALNAELEGTKAGEVGRGFSLVAAEMRRLAENVLRSTQQIGQLIQEIRDATNAAVMATEAGVKASERGTGQATEVLESLTTITDMARLTVEAVRAISLATQQQQTGTRQLAEAMAEILRVTEVSSSATQQMSTANMDLSSLSESLRAAVERFKVQQA